MHAWHSVSLANSASIQYWGYWVCTFFFSCKMQIWFKEDWSWAYTAVRNQLRKKRTKKSLTCWGAEVKPFVNKGSLNLHGDSYSWKIRCFSYDKLSCASVFRHFELSFCGLGIDSWALLGSFGLALLWSLSPLWVSSDRLPWGSDSWRQWSAGCMAYLLVVLKWAVTHADFLNPSLPSLSCSAELWVNNSDI